MTRELKVRVKVESVGIGWNKITLQGLSIANSVKTVFPYALSIDSICVETDFLHLWDAHKRIRDLTIRHPVIKIELFNYSGSANNVAQLINSLPKSAMGGDLFSIDRVRIYDLHFSGERSNGKPLMHLPVVAFLEFKPEGLSTLSVSLRSIFEMMAEQAKSPRGLLNEVRHGRAG